MKFLDKYHFQNKYGVKNKCYFLNDDGEMDAKEQDFRKSKPSRMPKCTSGLALDLRLERRVTEKWKLIYAKSRFNKQMSLHAYLLYPMDLSGDRHRRN